MFLRTKSNRKNIQRRQLFRRILACESLEQRNLMATYVVNSFLDGPINPANDAPIDAPLVPPAAGKVLSLREAIILANANPGADTIQLTTGNYVLNRAAGGGPPPADATFGDLDITSEITIVGASQAGTTISILGVTDRVLEIGAGAIVTLRDLTVQNGNVTAGNGGGILTAGNLTLERVNVTNNQTSQQGGGGIYQSGGTLSLTNSTVSNNRGTGPLSHGGGIFVAAGTATLLQTVVSGNTTAGEGGGVYVAGGTVNLNTVSIDSNTSASAGGGVGQVGGTLGIASSSITSNRATGPVIGVGGGIFVADTATAFQLTNVTVAANQGLEGSGLRLNLAGAVILSSTIADNLGSPGIFVGGSLALNGSIVDRNTTADLAGAGTITGAANVIGNRGATTGLANGTNTNSVGFASGLAAALFPAGNGTQVYPLLNSSTAINRVPTALVGVDQRARARGTRLLGDANTNTGLSDSGAYEVQGSSFTVRKYEETGTIDNAISLGDTLRAGWGMSLFVGANQIGTTQITAANGEFTFSNLIGGSYRVDEELRTNWVSSDGVTSKTLAVPSETTVANRLDFFNYRLGEIRGLVFEDKDFSGNTSDSATAPVPDVGLANVRVSLIYAGVNLNGSTDNVFGNANDEIVSVPLTNSTGNFRAIGLKAGSYRLRINPADNPITVAQPINFANVDFSTETYKSLGFTAFTISASGQLFAANPAVPGAPAADSFQQVLPIPGAGSLSIGVFERATLIVSTFNDLNRDQRRNSDSITIGGPLVADQNIANVPVALGTGTSVPTLANGTVTFAGLGRNAQIVTIGLDANTSEFSFNEGNYASTRTVTTGAFRSGETININAGIFRFGEILGFAFGDKDDDGKFVVSATAPRDLLLPNVQVDLYRNNVKLNIAPVVTDINGRFAFLPTAEGSTGVPLPKLTSGNYELRLTDPSGRLYGEPRPAIDTAGIVSKPVAVISFRVTSGKVWVSALPDKPDASLDVVQRAAKIGSTNAQVLTTLDSNTLPALAVPFGFGGIIRGRVVLDKNANGFNLAGTAPDPGIDTFVVELYRRNPDLTFSTTPSATRTSSQGGLYEFTGLQRGTYSVRLKTTAGELVTKHYQLTTVQPDSLTVRLNDILASDTGRAGAVQADQTVTVVNQPVTPSPAIAPNVTSTTRGLAFGVQRFGAIYGQVFNDLNADGVKAATGELGVGIIRVRLYKYLGASVDLSVTPIEKLTAANGSYFFEDLTPGEYLVTASYPEDKVARNTLGIVAGITEPGQATQGQTTPNVKLTVAYNIIEVGEGIAEPRKTFEISSTNLITLDSTDINNKRLTIGTRALVNISGVLIEGGVPQVGKTALLRRKEGNSSVNNSNFNGSPFEPDVLPAFLSTKTDAAGKYSFWVWPGEYEVAQVLTTSSEPFSAANGAGTPVQARRFDTSERVLTAPDNTFPKIASTTLADLNNDGIDDLIVANERVNMASSVSEGNVLIFLGQKNLDGKVGFKTTSDYTFSMGINSRPQFVTTGNVFTSIKAIPSENIYPDIVIALAGDTTGRTVSQITEDTNLGRAFGGILILQNNLKAGTGFKVVDPVSGLTPSKLQDKNWKDTLSKPAIDKTVGGNSPQHVRLFDVNRDGWLDIVTTNTYAYNTSIPNRPIVRGSEDISIAINTKANGVFSKSLSSPINLSTPSLAAGVTSTTLYRETPTSPAVLAASAFRTPKVVLREWVSTGPTTGSFATARPDITFASTQSPTSVSFADLRGDGSETNGYELVIAGLDGIRVYSGRGASWTLASTVSTKAKAQSISIGDINGDNRLDIAAAFESDGSFQYFINKGSNTFSASTPLFDFTFSPSMPQSTSSKTFVQEVKLGKLNNDNFADLVVTHLAGGLTIHANLELDYKLWQAGTVEVLTNPAPTRVGPSPLPITTLNFVNGEGVVPYNGLTQIRAAALVRPNTVPANTGNIDPLKRIISIKSFQVQPNPLNESRNFANFRSGAPGTLASSTPATSILRSKVVGEGEGPVLQRDRMDTNGDGFTTALDVLLVINSLNRPVALATSDAASTAVTEVDGMLDVNGDGIISPIDVLLIINALNKRDVVNVEPLSDTMARQLEPTPMIAPMVSVDTKLKSVGFEPTEEELDSYFASELASSFE